MNTSLRRRLVFLVAVAATAACKGDPPIDPNAGPGFLTVSMNTPNANDGGVLITVTGGTMDSVQAVSAGHTVFSTSTGTSQITAIVAGSLTDGAILRFWVPERDAVASYLATLQEAAARVTYEQLPLGGYSLTVAR